MAGPMGMINCVVAAFLLPHIAFAGQDRAVFTLTPFTLWQFFLLFFVGDLGLYWGHRIQHTFEYLWTTRHSFHHQLGTPMPISTLYIDSDDATLQGGLPIMIAAALVRPHPVLFLLYTFARVSENVINHSGLDHWLLNLVSLKVLPGRAGVDHHDAHHQFSNYGPGAKNFAEAFWVWDWLFGTLSNTVRTRKTPARDNGDSKKK
eukprot:INCI9747.1.p1 GENE.INCI9747.1~~INCI9747.1.p1  ORF type:complete len:204 (-),score=28.01 INCI9747.1:234-845(-)